MSEVWEQYMNKPNNKDDREVLTDDCIREDLSDRVKLTGIRLALFSIPFALLVCVFCFFPELIFIYLLLCIAVLGYMVYFIRRFVIALSGYMHCRKHIRVVTDRKCGEKIVYAWWADSIVGLFQKWCYLFFSKYGRYHLPYISYKWSENNRINHYQLMELTYDKDEFYLVLDRKERILVAYPCKFFQYSENVSMTK